MYHKKTFLCAGLLLVFGLFFFLQKNYQKAATRLSSSIEAGLDFIDKNQTSYGEIASEMCETMSMENCSFVSSIFPTTSVLYSIQDIPNEKVSHITRKGISFLLEEENPQGLWRYFGKRNKAINIVPDTDDTALTSYVLQKNSVPFTDNRRRLQNNHDENGIFYTWIDPLRLNGKNSIDCAVNANALLYLKENNPAVCNYLNAAISENQSCATYYANKFSFYYALSRASKEGLSCVEKSSTFVVKNILTQQKKDGSFGNDLENALALNTLLNFKYSGKEVARGINFILQKQTTEGFWEGNAYFDHGNNTPPYFGSPEITTALSLEALYSFQKNFLNILYFAFFKK